MPRNRRKVKGASGSASSNDQNSSSNSHSSASLSSENGKHAGATSVNKGQQERNRAVANGRAPSDSSSNSLFAIGDRPPAKKEKSSVSAPVPSSDGGHSKPSTFWSSTPVGILKTPARKISDVGAAIKRKLKQNFAVSFLLDPPMADENLPCGKLDQNSRHSTKMDDSFSASADYYLPPSGPGIRPVPSANTLNRLERQDIVIWRRPIQTLKFFFLELGWLIYENTLKLWSNRKYVLLAMLMSVIAFLAYRLPGPHQMALRYFEKKMFWCAYWIGLGVLSSVGLGTGLHTFLLYLGPHIASVTLAAYECHSLKFPEPPYPDQIICPVSTQNAPNSSNYVQQQQEMHSARLDDAATTLSSLVATTAVVSLWQIMYKVALESFMWGAGTALGELPPYFMARAARLSGQEPDDEDYQEYIQYIRSTRAQEEQSVLSRGKMYVEKLVEYAGFWGILACASIPNPFFDLAGITCGHFLVPFATFFAATLIGKAIIKMTIQQVFIILAFSEHHMEAMIHRIKYIPVVGSSLQAPFKEYLKQQKTKLHRKPGDPITQKSSLLGKFFELIVVVMIGFFVVSLVNSLAQNYHRRQWQAKKRELEAKLH